MKPVANILPKEDLVEVLIAEDQPEYETLPAIQFSDGTVLTRWKMSFVERLRVLIFGDIYLQVMTFGNPLQPVLLQVESPEVKTKRTEIG